MAVILTLISNISEVASTSAEEATLIGLINSFRTQAGDKLPTKNTLHNQVYRYDDNLIISFFEEGTYFLNSGTPPTNYNMFSFLTAFPGQRDLLVKSAIIHHFMYEGLLQLGNAANYNDSGFAFSINDKHPQYQGWLGFYLQTFGKRYSDFKAGILMATTPNSGFVGIESEFGWGMR